MIRHILIVAWRNICKYKVSAGIAVVGLAMGLLCFVLCNFCARLFFSIDKVFPNYDRMAEIQIKVGEGGRAFGSVSSKEIAAAVKEQMGLDVDKKKIHLKETIKSLGTHNVPVKLHPEVTAELKVVVKEEA